MFGWRIDNTSLDRWHQETLILFGVWINSELAYMIFNYPIENVLLWIIFCSWTSWKIVLLDIYIDYIACGAFIDIDTNYTNYDAFINIYNTFYNINPCYLKYDLY